MAAGTSGDFVVRITNQVGSLTTAAVTLRDRPPRPPFHTADTSGDSRLDLVELLRVIQLYNTRFGTTRTGRYWVGEGTVGFEAENALDAAAEVTLSAYPAADAARARRLACPNFGGSSNFTTIGRAPCARVSIMWRKVGPTDMPLVQILNPLVRS